MEIVYVKKIDMKMEIRNVQTAPASAKNVLLNLTI
jgi:hypothetical protein